MDNHIIEHLKELRLIGFVEGVQEQRTLTSYRDLPFEERLSLLVERERVRRDNVRLLQRLKNAKLKSSLSIEDITFEVARGIDKSRLLELASGVWLSQVHNLIITGPTGVGKTSIASALGDRACRLGFSVFYTKADDLIAELLMARSEGSAKVLRAKLARFSLLIIDEWMRDPLKAAQARELLNVLDERCRKASTLFVSQIPVASWYQNIEDPTLADAILDRIVHDAIRVELAGESMRKLTSSLRTTKKGETSLRSDSGINISKN